MRSSSFTRNLVFLIILMLINKVYALTPLQPQISHSSVHYLISNIQYIWTKFKSSCFRIASVKVSISTLMCTLRQLHFTNKDISGKALKCNDRDRTIYMNHIAELVPNPDMFMVGDEASKDERTSNRHRGWSQQGTQCVQQKCFVQGKRFSILPRLLPSR